MKKLDAAKIRIDEHTFRAIYDLYFDSICVFLGYYTKDTTVIEDTVQDVFVSLWENRACVDIQYIKTYLFHAARNRMLNYLRNTENRALSLQIWAQEKQEIDAHDCYDLNEFIVVLKQAIDILPDKCKNILLLNKEEKLTYQQIADYYDISVKTVESQMSIALKRIRSYVISNYGKTLQVTFLCFWFSL